MDFVEIVYVFVEVSRFVYVDWDVYFVDPDFVMVLDGFLSIVYLDQCVWLINLY